MGLASGDVNAGIGLDRQDGYRQTIQPVLSFCSSPQHAEASSSCAAVPRWRRQCQAKQQQPLQRRCWACMLQNRRSVWVRRVDPTSAHKRVCVCVCGAVLQVVYGLLRFSRFLDAFLASFWDKHRCGRMLSRV